MRVAAGAGLVAQRMPGPSLNAPESPVLIARLCSPASPRVPEGRKESFQRDREGERAKKKRNEKDHRGETGMVTQLAGRLSVLSRGEMSEAFRRRAAAAGSRTGRATRVPGGGETGEQAPNAL